MNRFQLFTMLIALIVTALVSTAGYFLIAPPRPLIVRAEFSHTLITPNADGIDDITAYEYVLSQNALVSLTFTSQSGDQFVFRDHVQRVQDIVHQGFFSGVVDGFALDHESIVGNVERRLMPEAVYTWELIAQTQSGTMESRTGTLTIHNADAQLPEMPIFSVSPTTITPNQDGIDDRTQINIELVKRADLDVYLTSADGEAVYYLPPRVEETRDGEAGRYTYDYDGGIDGGADPPPDGTYTLIATAQDAVGQRITHQTTLTLRRRWQTTCRNSVTAKRCGCGLYRHDCRHLFPCRP